MKFFEIKRLLSNTFQKTIKNIVSLGNDSTLESDKKPLKIGGKNTPIEISSDNVFVNGIEVNTKYQYETKFIGFYSTATANYLPMTGYIIEKTSTTSSNEFLGFCAPFNGTIEKITVRSEIAQDGSASFRVNEAVNETEVAATLIFRQDNSIDIADDVYVELGLDNPSTGTSFSPLTKGRIYNIYLSLPSAPNDTNITIVFKWDITT